MIPWVSAPCMLNNWQKPHLHSNHPPGPGLFHPKSCLNICHLGVSQLLAQIPGHTTGGNRFALYIKIRGKKDKRVLAWCYKTLALILEVLSEKEGQPTLLCLANCVQGSLYVDHVDMAMCWNRSILGWNSNSAGIPLRCGFLCGSISNDINLYGDQAYVMMVLTENWIEDLKLRRHLQC